ncbi:Serine/threonine-protein kinase MRCK alpha [Bienertia sinuspersici]
MSSFNNNSTSTPNFDNLLLQSLMGRLQLRQQLPSLNPDHPLLSQSFEDLLLDAASNGGRFSDFSFSDDEADFSDNGDFKTQLSKEESKLEKELIKIILSGKTENLKPNSGQAVAIGEHHICIGFHEETGSDYRVWEWHGHIMLFDEENGYTPEYIYGNYFEKLMGKGRKEKKEKEVVEEEDDSEQKVENLGGLKELIEGGDSAGSRILHQSRNAGSPRK